MIKGHRVRIYPTKKQIEIINKHIDAVRFIWNYMLELEDNRYKNHEKHLTGFDLCKHLTQIKKDENYKWLYEVSNASLQVTCRDLDQAYISFFNKRTGHPKFKSKKKSKRVYGLRSDGVNIKSDYISIPKAGKIKYRTDYMFPNGTKFINPRISEMNGKYYISFCVEYENQVFDNHQGITGIDLGVKELAVVAHNDDVFIYHNINKSKRLQTIDRKIRSTQKRLSRKFEASKRKHNKYVYSNNIKKEIIKLRRLYKRAKDIRTNYLHQTTHDICKRMPNVIVMEDLNLVSLGRNAHIKKQVLDQCLSEFYRQMMYKSKERSIEFIKADRYYPSSKICSCCGSIKRDLRLCDRIYVCDSCGYVIDRDINAARNLQKYVCHTNGIQL